MSKKKSQYYVVWVGRTPGLYDSWEACEAEVKGVAARYKGFATRAEAEVALTKSWEDYYTSKTSKTSATSVTSTTDNPLPLGSEATVLGKGCPKGAEKGLPILPALAVDAACSGNPGDMEFRGVIADTGTEVFRRGPYRCGTNNIGEFLAIILGLAWLKSNNLPWVLYSDSKTAQSWIRQKQCKSKLEENRQNAEIFQMIRAGEKWLHENTWTTRILKWDTKHWGEIPADFGRK